MALSFKTLLSEYIVSEYARLEAAVLYAEKNIRWGDYVHRGYCSHDVAHLQLLICRFETFKDFSNNVMQLCRISEDDIVKYASSELEKRKRGD